MFVRSEISARFSEVHAIGFERSHGNIASSLMGFHFSFLNYLPLTVSNLLSHLNHRCDCICEPRPRDDHESDQLRGIRAELHPFIETGVKSEFQWDKDNLDIESHILFFSHF
jgi:hypothetical protein